MAAYSYVIKDKKTHARITAYLNIELQAKLSKHVTDEAVLLDISAQVGKFTSNMVVLHFSELATYMVDKKMLSATEANKLLDSFFNNEIQKYNKPIMEATTELLMKASKLATAIKEVQKEVGDTPKATEDSIEEALKMLPDLKVH